jgi:hypothetical protein
MKINTCPPIGVKSKPIVLLGLLLLFTIGLRAQSIHINFTNGNSASYYLEDLDKIKFDADLMNLILLNGTIYSWNVSTIDYYEYDESSLILQELLNDTNAWEVEVFPNPTSKSLNIRFNLSNEDEIAITFYDLQGKLFLERNLGKQLPGEHQETLDVNNFPVGTYRCRIHRQHQSVTKTVIIK